MRCCTLKAIVSLVLFLCALNGGLLYLHYSQSASANGEVEPPDNYRQEIEVINRADGLYIRHHFYNLSAGRYEIVWPKGSVEHGCQTPDAASCSRLNESGIAFDEGEPGQQSITYKLPRKKKLIGRELFKKPFVLLKDAKPLTTVFHMTDEQKLGGIWVNGLERVGIADKGRITYRLYRGVGFVNELYWQSQDIPLAYSSNKLTLYGEGIDEKYSEQMESMLEVIGSDHVNVLLSANNQPLYRQRFVVEKPQNINKVLTQVARMSVRSRFTLLADEPSMSSMLASLLTDDAIGTKAEQAIFNRLKEALGEDQYGKLRRRVQSEIGQKLSAAQMDSLLFEITGFESQFFKNTIHEKNYNYPFLLMDPREMLVESEVVPEAKIVVQNGQSYYPVEPLLAALDYKIRSNEQSVYMESPSNKYRFSKTQPFYVMNDKRFDYREIPLNVINQQWYVEENSFRRIFLVLIEKSDEAITIEPIEKLIKEMEEE